MNNQVKRKKKRIILIVIIIVIGISVFFLMNPIRSLLAIITMKPLETGEVFQDVYAVRNSFNNLYLLKSGEKYIAFDGGSDNKATKSALDDLGIDINDITAIFLTHTDHDHTAAVTLFTSAEIYMADSNRIFLEHAEGLNRSKAFLSGNGVKYQTLQDGETVTIGDTEIQCIFTPGHTPGSACYIADGNILFAGDNFNLKNNKAVLFNDIFNMDNYEQERSIRKLAKLENIEAVFTMHTGCATDFKAAFSDWF
ncbi:MAG: MBL fold metallo-hydrolase [Oscillospiraceae bacterium]|nr:MBL fold metallo-hydrolase [Oscillospiraceae bacterium]